MNTPQSPVHEPAIPTLEARRVKAVSIDLDDTLWPIWPTIERAEAALSTWLREHAPATAALAGNPQALREARHYLQIKRPDLSHDLSALRRESIRYVLLKAGDDPALAEPAFEVFFAERQRVQLFDDALPALEWLASRYPVIALSNGNADVHRVGLGQHFKGALSAREFGVGKPDARIFHAAADLAGVRPAEVLHIGDDAQLDVLGALVAGLQVAWVNRAGHAWEHAPLQPHATVADLMSLCNALA
ncbi:MAG: HAD family hydrolase [Hydrogenophaga sp.]|uniref:HAD family hydrolase n=1 Tax=Hydrogenophaga sp. TaxID=1904254 RepID=UPI001DE90EC1|nr:HAD family hydrolase [Hydrogenophaga sp.]MBX3610564.1 HAD family hydrolase [Hydrogenophaga sp.]